MILVTGAAGYLGRRVVRVLRKQGKPVVGLLRSRRNAALVEETGAQVLLGDVTDIASVERAMEGVDQVVHLVAVIRERGAFTHQAVNHEGTRHVVKAAHHGGVQRLVHLSAIGAGESPRFPYLRSKWQGEQMVRDGGVPFTILRCSFLFGAGDEFFNSLTALVKALPVVPIIGDGRVRFQPIDADEVAEAVANTLEDDSTLGQVLELGGPQQMPYNQVMDVVCEKLGARSPLVHVAPGLLRPVITLMERLLPRPPITCNMLDMVAMDSVTDANAAPRLLGRTPRSLAAGLDYIRQITFSQAWRLLLGLMPTSIRDH